MIFSFLLPVNAKQNKEITSSVQVISWNRTVFNFTSKLKNISNQRVFFRWVFFFFFLFLCLSCFLIWELLKNITSHLLQHYDVVFNLQGLAASWKTRSGFVFTGQFGPNKTTLVNERHPAARDLIIFSLTSLYQKDCAIDCILHCTCICDFFSLFISLKRETIMLWMLNVQMN